MAKKIVCEKCGREKPETDFFKMKTGNRDTLCKPCLTALIDNYEPDTFMWILERYNVPYIEEVWDNQVQKILAKQGPAKFGSGSVIGPYIRLMNMTQYNQYTFADTQTIKLEAEKKKAEEEARKKELKKQNDILVATLQAKRDNGEISDAEFRTLTAEPEDKPKTNSQFIFNNVDEDELLKQLDADEQLYLMTKWGAYYKPSEWLQMEKIYKNYENEYELNIDRQEALKKICKISLKMDQAIDAGDVTDSKNYANILDTLRKSAKFTEAQNKEEQQVRELDSIGELIAICERDGGIIEQFPTDPDEYPQDKIDFTIKDLKAYNYNLVVNELGLGDLIESYIEKLEKREEMDAAEVDNMITSAEEEMEQMLTDEEAIDFQNYLMDELEADAEALIAEVNDESK